MSDLIKEQLSALMDGELPAAERHLLLERLAREPALREQWARYQLISSALHQGLPKHIDLRLAERVQTALADAEVHHAASSRLPRLLKPLAGLAVAASVAVVAILAVQQTQTPGSSPLQVAVTPVDPGVMPGPEAYTRVTGTRWDVQQQQVRERLNEYLVNHSEYAASGGMPGMQPYVRIVGYDQE